MGRGVSVLVGVGSGVLVIVGTRVFVTVGVEEIRNVGVEIKISVDNVELGGGGMVFVAVGMRPGIIFAIVERYNSGFAE